MMGRYTGSDQVGNRAHPRVLLHRSGTGAADGSRQHREGMHADCTGKGGVGGCGGSFLAGVQGEVRVLQRTHRGE